jgi:hypothetical protein
LKRSQKSAHTHEHHGVSGAHPLASIEHPHDDTVCRKNCDEWTKLWLEWMLTQPSERNPLLPEYDDRPFEIDISQGKTMCDGDESVWFLAGPPYSAGAAGTYSKYVVVPRGRWHILASPFASYVSQEEYPSIPANQLFERAKQDIDSLYKLEATLDGLNLSGCRVQIRDPFSIKNIPQRNVLALSPEELIECKSTAKMCMDGYFFWLKPLEPGLHQLRLLAYSRVYKFDVEFQLNVRGPK